MRTSKAVITGTSFALVAWVCAAGCSNKTNPNTGGDTFNGDTSSSSGAGTSSSGGAGSGSSGGSSSGGSSTMPTAEYADGGIACGAGTGCPQSDECCYGGAPMVSTEAGPPGFGGLGGFGGAAAGPTCTAAGSCSGSSLSCSNPAQCASGQTCCFAYDQSEAGAAPGVGFGGFGGLGGGMMTFTAQCADSCSTGDMVHYQLCASSTDCPSGQSCTMGPYAMYCADMGGGGFPGGGMPGGPTNPGAMGDDGGSVDDGGTD